MSYHGIFAKSNSSSKMTPNKQTSQSGAITGITSQNPNYQINHNNPNSNMNLIYPQESDRIAASTSKKGRSSMRIFAQHAMTIEDAADHSSNTAEIRDFFGGASRKLIFDIQSQQSSQHQTELPQQQQQQQPPLRQSHIQSHRLPKPTSHRHNALSSSSSQSNVTPNQPFKVSSSENPPGLTSSIPPQQNRIETTQSIPSRNSNSSHNPNYNIHASNSSNYNFNPKPQQQLQQNQQQKEKKHRNLSEDIELFNQATSLPSTRGDRVNNFSPFPQQSNPQNPQSSQSQKTQPNQIPSLTQYPSQTAAQTQDDFLEYIHPRQRETIYLLFGETANNSDAQTNQQHAQPAGIVSNQLGTSTQRSSGGPATSNVISTASKQDNEYGEGEISRTKQRQQQGYYERLDTRAEEFRERLRDTSKIISHMMERRKRFLIEHSELLKKIEADQARLAVLQTAAKKRAFEREIQLLVEAIKLSIQDLKDKHKEANDLIVILSVASRPREGQNSTTSINNNPARQSVPPSGQSRIAKSINTHPIDASEQFLQAQYLYDQQLFQGALDSGSKIIGAHSIIQQESNSFTMLPPHAQQQQQQQSPIQLPSASSHHQSVVDFDSRALQLYYEFQQQISCLEVGMTEYKKYYKLDLDGQEFYHRTQELLNILHNGSIFSDNSKQEIILLNQYLGNSLKELSVQMKEHITVLSQNYQSVQESFDLVSKVIYYKKAKIKDLRDRIAEANSDLHLAISKGLASIPATSQNAPFISQTVFASSTTAHALSTFQYANTSNNQPSQSATSFRSLTSEVANMLDAIRGNLMKITDTCDDMKREVKDFARDAICQYFIHLRLKETRKTLQQLKRVKGEAKRLLESLELAKTHLSSVSDALHKHTDETNKLVLEFKRMYLNNPNYSPASSTSTSSTVAAAAAQNSARSTAATSNRLNNQNSKQKASLNTGNSTTIDLVTAVNNLESMHLRCTQLIASMRSTIMSECRDIFQSVSITPPIATGVPTESAAGSSQNDFVIEALTQYIQTVQQVQEEVGIQLTKCKNAEKRTPQEVIGLQRVDELSELCRKEIDWFSSEANIVFFDFEAAEENQTRAMVALASARQAASLIEKIKFSNTIVEKVKRNRNTLEVCNVILDNLAYLQLRNFQELSFEITMNHELSTNLDELLQGFQESKTNIEQAIENETDQTCEPFVLLIARRICETVKNLNDICEFWHDGIQLLVSNYLPLQNNTTNSNSISIPAALTPLTSLFSGAIPFSEFSTSIDEFLSFLCERITFTLSIRELEQIRLTLHDKMRESCQTLLVFRCIGFTPAISFSTLDSSLSELEQYITKSFTNSSSKLTQSSAPFILQLKPTHQLCSIIRFLKLNANTPHQLDPTKLRCCDDLRIKFLKAFQSSVDLYATSREHQTLLISDLLLHEITPFQASNQIDSNPSNVTTTNNNKDAIDTAVIKSQLEASILLNSSLISAVSLAEDIKSKYRNTLSFFPNDAADMLALTSKLLTLLKQISQLEDDIDPLFLVPISLNTQQNNNSTNNKTSTIPLLALPSSSAKHSNNSGGGSSNINSNNNNNNSSNTQSITNRVKEQIQGILLISDLNGLISEISVLHDYFQALHIYSECCLLISSHNNQELQLLQQPITSIPVPLKQRFYYLLESKQQLQSCLKKVYDAILTLQVSSPMTLKKKGVSNSNMPTSSFNLATSTSNFSVNVISNNNNNSNNNKQIRLINSSGIIQATKGNPLDLAESQSLNVWAQIFKIVLSQLGGETVQGQEVPTKKNLSNRLAKLSNQCNENQIDFIQEVIAIIQKQDNK